MKLGKKTELKTIKRIHPPGEKGGRKGRLFLESSILVWEVIRQPALTGYRFDTLQH